MRRNIFIYGCACFAFFIAIVISCNKEYSKEGNALTAAATGSLLDSLNNCNQVFIHGDYQPNISFSDSDYVIVQANITSTGTYTIFSDTINGFYFRDSGIVNNTGIQQFKLKAFGKFLSPVDCNFTLHFDTSMCGFVVPFSDSAIYSFAGTGGSCTDAVVNGIYTTGSPLNISDSVNIQLQVTKPGTFYIQTATVNGVSFSATGDFNSTGNYVVALVGNGVPISAGTFIIPITIAGVDCSFPVTVTTDAAIIDSSMYWQFTANGRLYHGKLDSSIRSNLINANYPLNNIFQLQGYGTDADSATSFISFQFNISRINTNLSTGAYHPAIEGSEDFTGYVTHADYTGNLSSTNTQPSFIINVTVFDSSTRLVQGNFSGPVIDEFGKLDTMKNGFFSTYYKK